MSLEKALAENTAALTLQTAAIKAQMELLAKLAGSKAGAATTTATTAATTKPATTKAAAAPKAKTMDDVRTLAGKFLGVTDPTERAANKESMKALIAHFGVDRATAISEEQIPEMCGHLETLIKGETPDFMNEEAAAEDETMV